MRNRLFCLHKSQRPYTICVISRSGYLFLISLVGRIVYDTVAVRLPSNLAARHTKDHRQERRQKNKSTDYRLQTTDYRLQTTECRIQTTVYRLQSTDNRLQTTDYTDYRLQTTDYRLQTIQTTDYRLQTIDYRLYRLQIIDYRLQTTDYRLMTSVRKKRGGD